MAKSYRLLTLILLMLLPQARTVAQEHIVVSGRVTDDEGQPVGQAAVALEGTSMGTYTDDEGKYTLQARRGRYTLVASCIGYATERVEVELKRHTIYNITLRETGVSLRAVEVHGKSEAQRVREGAFSVSAIDIRPIVNSLTNLNDLVDRATGIRVRQEGGIGSDYDLSVNGLSGNSVRYFIDGVPMDTKGSNVSLSNLPVNIIERIEIYKGVVPASLGTDALGGAINIITKAEKKNYVDASYGIGSFHTHRADVDAQFVIPRTGLIIRPTVGINYSRNDYKMKGVELWDEEERAYLPVTRKRFHDDYFSLLAVVEVGVSQRSWADDFFVSASYFKEDNELQTGSIQTKVYGMAEKNSDAWSLSARYSKRDFLVEHLTLKAALSHTWDHSITTDTAYRQYDWNGDYIIASRNEITGRARSIRHIKRPLTVGQLNIDYEINAHHRLNLAYNLSRTGNRRTDDVDDTFTPANDVLTKHIVSLSYQQSFLEGRMDNTFFVKDYVNHVNIRQDDLYWLTGSDSVTGSITKNYIGYGAGMRLKLAEPLSIKASYEHSVRLPLSRELLGNGSTIYANVALSPENSHNINLGVFGTWHPGQHHTLYYEATGFLRYVDDYIQAEVSEKEGMMQYVNQPAIHVRGVEGELRYDFSGRLQLNANFSFQDARDRMKYKNDGKVSATYNNRVPNTPWMFGGAELTYTWRELLPCSDKLRLSVNYQGVHWYYLTWEAYGSSESKARIPAQHVFGASLTYSWHDERWNVAVDCSNLFDRRVYDNYKLQRPGRAFFLKLRLFLS